MELEIKKPKRGYEIDYKRNNKRTKSKKNIQIHDGYIINSSQKEDNEKIFLREMKLLLMEGFPIKKYHERGGYSIRNLYYNAESNLFYWLQKNEMNMCFHLRDVMGIYKIRDSDELNENHRNVKSGIMWNVFGIENRMFFTEEFFEKIILIEIKINKNENHELSLKRIMLEFLDNSTRDMFYDGFHLFWKEYKLKQNIKRISFK